MLAIILGLNIFHFCKSYKKRKQRRWCIENALYSVEGIPIRMELKAGGKTILLVSHNEEDIKVLCDEIFEMDKGKVKKFH